MSIQPDQSNKTALIVVCALMAVVSGLTATLSVTVSSPVVICVGVGLTVVVAVLLGVVIGRYVAGGGAR
jgi:hypothetical protein